MRHEFAGLELGRIDTPGIRVRPLRQKMQEALSLPIHLDPAVLSLCNKSYCIMPMKSDNEISIGYFRS
jgi:hypothetical protein